MAKKALQLLEFCRALIMRCVLYQNPTIASNTIPLNLPL